MKIFLLTHERETRRPSNTGAIAIEHANELVERIIWERVSPNKKLVQLIANNEAVLLYSKREQPTAKQLADQPAEQLSKHLVEPAHEVPERGIELLPELSPKLATIGVKASIEEYENVIIIDSTWQEAQKIFNQSDYLKAAAQFTLNVKNDSLYTLRANQPKGGLCTIECIIEVLKLKGRSNVAAELSAKFALFNR